MATLHDKQTATPRQDGRFSEAKTFEDFMKLELSYMHAEFAAVKAHDFHAADYFHDLRWKCMDAAVKASGAA